MGLLLDRIRGSGGRDEEGGGDRGDWGSWEGGEGGGGWCCKGDLGRHAHGWCEREERAC